MTLGTVTCNSGIVRLTDRLTWESDVDGLAAMAALATISVKVDSMQPDGPQQLLAECARVLRGTAKISPTLFKPSDLPPDCVH